MRRPLSAPLLMLILIICLTSAAFSQMGTVGASSPNPVPLAPLLSDFDGDGMADLNWHNNATGETTVWRMNGLNVTGTMLGMTISDTNWRPLLSADFNDDGKADMLWHNSSTNTNYLWMTNDSLWFDGYGLEPVNDPNWQIIGSADFDGDGKSDLLWRNSQTGDNYVWFMNGASLKSTGWMQGVAGTDWQFVAIADFNGDGKPDLLWHNVTTGVYYIWLMDGTTIAAAASPGTITDPNWQIAAIADFNGDHRVEILWRNVTTGDNYMWMLNPDGTFASGAGVQGVADMNWQIVAVGDLDGDKKADLVWRNTATGANYVWFMDGATLVNSGGIPAMTDQNWTLGSSTISSPTVTAPSFSPGGGTYSTPQTVTLSTTPGASIRYTTDGSTPTATHGTLYSDSAPIAVSVTTTISAIAYKSGYTSSNVVTNVYTFTCGDCGAVVTPTFSPAAGPFYAATPVTITSDTSGATIYYTTDGSTPSATNGTLYTGPVTVQSAVNTDMSQSFVTNASGVTMLKAVAIKSGMTPSDVFTGNYIIINPLRYSQVSSQVLGLAHMAYNVSSANWNSVLSMWMNYLGFDTVVNSSGFALIKINDQQYIELYQGPITSPQYQLKNFGFYVTDAEAFRQRLAKAGVTVPSSSTVNALGNLSFFTTDPDGHVNEWVQYLPGSVTSQSLGQHMPGTQLFGYMDNYGDATASPTVAANYYAQFGFGGTSKKVYLPNSNSYLEMLTYSSLSQSLAGKHEKAQLVNFRGHDLLTDANALQTRDPSITQTRSTEGGSGGFPTHNCLDIYNLDLSRIRMIDINY
jgi:hypothetical protein